MRKISVCLLTLGVLVGLAQLVPASAPTLNATSVSHVSSTSPSADAKDAKTFSGRIAQMDGKYVLQDTADKATFLLDDQEKAKQFDGQQVKVTGTLDTATNTIHVMEIEAA